MIMLKEIEKTYGNRKVLTDINITFNDQSITVVKGVSGCGKTTLLNILGGLIEDYAGEYIIDGVDAKKLMKNGYQKHIAYIFQQSLLFQHMNVMDNLLFIRDDTASIMDYVHLFQMEHLLYKSVVELSNGERQRVSIIRALLLEPQILLCDEPSASLDAQQSAVLAEAIKQLKVLNKTVIIATHEDCFDAIADRVLDIHYGKLQCQEEMPKTITSIPAIEDKKEKQLYKSSLKRDIFFAFRRSKKSSVFANICFIIIFLSFFLSASMFLHFSKSYKDYVYKSYPYQMIYLNKNAFNKVNEMKYKIYENVSYHTKDAEIYPIYDYRDSVLRIPNAIAAGNFTNDKHKVMVNQIYVNHVLHVKNISSVIGRTIQIENQTYTIAGVMSSDKNLLELITKNAGYDRNFDQPVIFMQYTQLCKIGKITSSDHLMVSVQNTPQGSANLQFLSDNVGLPWLSMVNENVTAISFFMTVFLVCLGSIAIIIFLFSINLIYLSLFYRKKEFGVLQLLSIAKTRIRRIIFFEYFMKILFALILCDFLYVAIGIFIDKQIGFMFWLSLSEIFIIHICLFCYIYVLTFFPLRKILKKSTIELIQD